MKQPILITFSLAIILSVSACHKAIPVAARPPEPAPVASAPAKVATPAPAQSAAKQAPSRPIQTAETRPTTMPAAERATLNDRLTRLSDALFDYDKATIRSDASTALSDDVGVIRDILANYPSQKLMIEGHADERGSSEYNLALGDKRAVATEEFLATMGIPKSQLEVISYGKERPVCTDRTEACWQKNRRTHITAAR